MISSILNPERLDSDIRREKRKARIAHYVEAFLAVVALVAMALVGHSIYLKFKF